MIDAGAATAVAEPAVVSDATPTPVAEPTPQPEPQPVADPPVAEPPVVEPPVAEAPPAEPPVVEPPAEPAPSEPRNETGAAQVEPVPVEAQPTSAAALPLAARSALVDPDAEAELAPTGGTTSVTTDRVVSATVASVGDKPAPLRGLVTSDDQTRTALTTQALTRTLYFVAPTVPASQPSARRTPGSEVPPPPAAGSSSRVTVPLTGSGLLPSDGTGGSTSRLAGLLAFVMGMMPFAPSEGAGTGPPPQLAILALGILIAPLAFFAFPLRDRRRREPRGFATLTLRPG